MVVDVGQPVEMARIDGLCVQMGAVDRATDSARTDRGHPMTITPETVAAAREVRSWHTLHSNIQVVDAEYHATLVELCRQQHKALKAARATTPYWNVHNVPTLNRIDTLLALWPDDPTEEKP